MIINKSGASKRDARTCWLGVWDYTLDEHSDGERALMHFRVRKRQPLIDESLLFEFAAEQLGRFR
jgi:hypothetical protein